MVRFHEENEAKLTVACVPVEKARSRHLGIAVVDDKWRITGFQEKPDKDPATIPGDPDRCLASMGVYVFETEELVRRVTRDSRTDSAHDFGKNIIPTMVRDGASVFAFPFQDENKKEVPYWRDVGTIDSYFEANLDLVSVSPLFNLYDDIWPIRSYRDQFPPAKFVFSDDGPNARRGQALDSIVASGVIVSGGTLERSVVSSQVRINSYSHVSESILMEGVDVGRHAKIRRAIVDKGVQIPESFVVGYDPDEDRKRFTVTDKGVVVVPKEMALA
jgi:glucose-1-phosphate adenylyltransferase